MPEPAVHFCYRALGEDPRLLLGRPDAIMTFS